MTIEDYLRAHQQQIFDSIITTASGYIAIELYINKMGKLDWTIHLTDSYREAGIYKQAGQGAVLAFATIPMLFFTNVRLATMVSPGGTATAEDLIDELYYENLNQVQDFSILVETRRALLAFHFLQFVPDKVTQQTNRTHPLCW